MQHSLFDLFLPLKLKWPFQKVSETLLLWAKIETKLNRKKHFGDSQLLLKANLQSPEMVCKALPGPGPWLPFLSLPTTYLSAHQQPGQLPLLGHATCLLPQALCTCCRCPSESFAVCPSLPPGHLLTSLRLNWPPLTISSHRPAYSRQHQSQVRWETVLEDSLVNVQPYGDGPWEQASPLPSLPISSSPLNHYCSHNRNSIQLLNKLLAITIIIITPNLASTIFQAIF